MATLILDDFDAFFRALHHCEPYDWQRRLAKRAVAGDWPAAIDLPTGSGKTACLDIAVFAMAHQAARAPTERTAPRRVVFCVNRRLIVDEAFDRARRIAQMIAQAEGDASSVLGRVAAALRSLSTLPQESAPPLDVLELRGGIYRDNRWARSATQPTILCSTIDQIGSRLLFRAYGVSPQAAPIQAALLAYDSLLLLDEAHISRPFLQTLEFVQRYLDPQKWAEQPIRVHPMVVVPMTATPPEGVCASEVIRLEEKDRENEGLNNRLKASKPAILVAVADVVKAAVERGIRLAQGQPTAVGIIVNRVATARAIYARLRQLQTEPNEKKRKLPAEATVELVIGSMRPIDRDRQAERLRPLIGPERPARTTQTSFVVATQCLEVGADYDFDALVTECASLDALRQRFGRLNRGGRAIQAQAVILIDKKQTKHEASLDDAKPLDPIYGNALTRSWHWLKAVARDDTIDFGIDAFDRLLQQQGDNGRIPQPLLAPSARQDAPVMLPAYLDLWCQTAPRPTPDPDVTLFIHGPQAAEPDVQVCWRADLIDDQHLTRRHWLDVVSLLPPTGAECMSVPISRVRRWLAGQSDPGTTGDLLEAVASEEAESDNRSRCQGVLWRGPRDHRLLQSPGDLRPGDTLVLPVLAGGWDELGHVPDATPETIDSAEFAFQTAHNRPALRLHPALKARLPDVPALAELLACISDAENPLPTGDLRQLLTQLASETTATHPDLAQTCRHLANPKFGLIREVYPDGRGQVLTTRHRIDAARVWYLPVCDEGDDQRSRTPREQPVALSDHCQHVHDEVLRIVRALSLNSLEGIFRLATDWHDLGKADERFQAMLRRTDRTDSWLLGAAGLLLAKSDGVPLTPQQQLEARQRAELPEGFRHEMLSVQLAEKLASGENLSISADVDLLLHLIAAHHGYARPFAPVVFDNDPPDVTLDSVTLLRDQRLGCPAHRIDSGIPDRFWQLTRRYGWWALAYLEAVLRLADWQASADEDAGLPPRTNPPSAANITPPNDRRTEVNQ